MSNLALVGKRGGGKKKLRLKELQAFARTQCFGPRTELLKLLSFGSSFGLTLKNWHFRALSWLLLIHVLLT